MAFILASFFDPFIWDENQISTNIKRFLRDTNRVVYIANNPDNAEENDQRAKMCFELLEQNGLSFCEKILLDKRNCKRCKEILADADLIILSGGKCLCQNRFFKKIKLKKLLKNYKGLAIGISAGTMNLCKTVANFPEETADLNDARWLKGLNFYDKTIIPHFDGEAVKYQIECEEIDLINDYVLPMSNKRDLIGIPNGSYILIDNDRKTERFGVMYNISKGKVEKLSER